MNEVNNNPLALTGSQLQTQLEQQMKFLQLIHPFLKEEAYHEECLELRPIRRTSGFPFKSLNLWRLDDKSIEFYKNFLYRINGSPVCLYYSVFTFDSKMECYKPDGTLYQKGCINNQNVRYTQILVMDFDGITDEEYLKHKWTLLDLDIETISIFTGHGYQDIILLNERIYDKDILKNFTNLLLSRGIPVDPSIIDPARVMRMPYSFNCKAYDSKSNYFSSNPEPIPVRVLGMTERRYSAEEIFQKIRSLPSINGEFEVENKEKNLPTTIEEELLETIDLDRAKEVNWSIPFEEIYPMLKDIDIPEPIRKMLYSTRKGYRNKSLLFLVPFLRNYLGLEINIIKEIISIWATRCIPQLEVPFARSEVDRLMTYDYDAKIGKYDDEMREEFGVIDLGEKDVYERNLGKVVIPNQIFSLYDSISDCAVKIYYAMKAEEVLSNKKEWIMEDILKVANISQATFFRNIKDLTKFNLVEKTRANKKLNQPAKYFLVKIKDISKGYTTFNPGIIENMIYHQKKSLTDGEIKLFTYLNFLTGNKRETWKSQEEIGKAINKKRNSVSEMIASLEEKGYIIKEGFRSENLTEHKRYIINYNPNYSPLP